MLYTKFQGHWPFDFREKYLQWRPSLSCDLDHLKKLLLPHLKEAQYEIWLQSAERFQRRCLKMLTYTHVVLLSRKKPYTGKSDPNPEAFIALIPETNFLPSRSDSLVAFLKLILDLSHSMIKPTKWPLHPAKTPISLGIRPVWSESSLCTLWVAKDPVLLQADSEDWSYSVNGQLIRVFAGLTSHFVGFVVLRLILTYCVKTISLLADIE